MALIEEKDGTVGLIAINKFRFLKINSKGCNSGINTEDEEILREHKIIK